MKSNSIVIDSSVFLSLFFYGEDFHKETSEFFGILSSLVESGWIFRLPMLVVFEVYHVLNRNRFFGEEGNCARFRDLFNSRIFEYVDLDFEFFNLFKQVNFFKKLKASDAIIASSAMFSNSFLISWDKKLLKNSHNGYTPVEFMEEVSGA